MTTDPWALAIDFGTSRTAGAMAGGGGAVTPLEVEGNRWMASLVLLDPDGEVLVGTAADNLAGVHPDRVERTPKRHLGGPAPLLLGDGTVEVPRAVAAVLAVFLAEGRLRHGGADPAASVLTHPVRWGDERKAALLAAAEIAGLPAPSLVDEPVAAAIHYVSDVVAVGEHVGVYDLGGGTFDTAVLSRTEGGFEVVGAPGGDEAIGGEVFDHRLFVYFGGCLAEDDPALWQQLLEGDDRKWKRAASDLLAQARRAKEALSSYTQTQVFVPIADRDLVVNRSQFEAMIVDDVERTVDLMEDTVADAGLTSDDLAALYLVGGSSRLPLVTQLMRERFGDRVTTRDEPKSVVVLGAAVLGARALGVTVTEGGPTAVGLAPLDSLPPPRADERLDVRAPPRAEDRLDVLAPPRPEDRIEQPVEVPAEAAPAPAPVERAPTSAPVAASLAPAPGDPPPPNLAWRIQLERIPGQIGTDGAAAYFGTEEAVLHAVDLAGGAHRFRVPLDSAVFGAPVASGGRVFAATLDGTVLAADAASGAVLWRLPTGAPVVGGPTLHDGVLYVGNDAGSVLVLDAESGAVRWQLPLQQPLRAGLPVAGGTLVAGCVDGSVFAVDAESGVVRWVYPCGGSVTGTPAVVGDTALVPGGDGLLYSLDLAGGQPRWAFRSGGTLATPVSLDGPIAWFAGTDGAVYGIDASTGETRRRIDTGSAYSSGPVARGGLVYLDTGAGELWVVEAATGSLRIRVATGTYNRCRPALAGSLVLVATTFAQLYAIVAPT